MSHVQLRYEPTKNVPGGQARHGVTLIEMLVAMAISLVMMAAVANLFAVVGGSVSASRASITQSEHLRSVRNRLQADLFGVTAPMLPPLRPENNQGYFEYIEGPHVDATAYNMNSTNQGQWNPSLDSPGYDTLTGDPDDVLMFTTRSKDGLPFVGHFNGSTIESQDAEVAWFTVANGRTVPLADANGNQLISNGVLVQAQLYTLYRRVLLIAPEYAASLPSPTPLGVSFYNVYDASARYDYVNAVMTLNTLSDVTKRENRFAHGPLLGATALACNFPFAVYLPSSAAGTPAPPAINNGAYFPQALAPFTVASGRIGEDVVLTNVLSFDVKIYDPTVPLYLTTAAPITALLPNDVGYWNLVGGTVGGYGGFVDLGYTWDYNYPNPSYPSGKAFPNSTNVSSVFSTFPTTMPAYGTQLGQYSSAVGNYSSATANCPTYDTWSLHYEGPGPWNSYTNYVSAANVTPTFQNYGINAVNGLDDDGLNGVDDPGEFAFPAPYTTPLRGIQVKIRTYEPDSKQIREVTIVQDFVPQ